MTTDNQSREAFEAWAISDASHTPTGDELYASAKTAVAWKAWQESRKQALEDLIAHFDCMPCGLEMFAASVADEIKEMLK